MILEPLIETETDYAALGMNFDQKKIIWKPN